MWVSLIQSVEGLNRTKREVSCEREKILQQTVLRLHLQREQQTASNWVSSLLVYLAGFGLSSLHNHYKPILSFSLYVHPLGSISLETYDSDRCQPQGSRPPSLLLSPWSCWTVTTFSKQGRKPPLNPDYTLFKVHFFFPHFSFLLIFFILK